MTSTADLPFIEITLAATSTLTIATTEGYCTHYIEQCIMHCNWLPLLVAIHNYHQSQLLLKQLHCWVGLQVTTHGMQFGLVWCHNSCMSLITWFLCIFCRLNNFSHTCLWKSILQILFLFCSICPARSHELFKFFEDFIAGINKTMPTWNEMVAMEYKCGIYGR